MHTFSRAALCCLLLLGLSTLPLPARANQMLALDNLVLDSQSGLIHLRFGLRMTQTSPIQDVLMEGVDLWLSVTAKLISKRLILPNTVMAERYFEHVLEWNSLTKEYELTLPQKEHLIKNKELDALLAEHWAEISLEMGEWSMLESGQVYHLELEIMLDRRDIPDWMRRVLFFWSWEIISPIRYELEFTVP